jgi:tetratricopeptide (TPR) repeat protein
VLSSLLSVGLIDWRDEEQAWTVSVHPLVAEVQRHTMTESERSTELGRAARTLHDTQRDLDIWHPDDWPMWRQIVPHLLAVAERAERLCGQPLDSLVDAIGRTVDALVTAGNHALAEDLGRRALAAVSRRGDDDSATLRARVAVALPLRVRGRLDEAEQIYRDVMTTLSRPGGGSRALLLHCRYQLALIHYARKDLRTAEQELQALRDEMRAVLGPEHRTTRITQFSLALVLRRRGDYQRALAELDDFLRSWVRSLGEEHPYSLYARQEWAFAKFKLGNPDEAEDELRSTLQAQLRVLGENHHSTLTTRESLAVLRHSHGEHAEAERELSSVVELRRRLFGINQPDTQEAEETLRELRSRPEE